MKTLKSALLIAVLTVTISSTALAVTGNISGTRTGNISGTRTGNISGTRTGNISGTRTGNISGTRTGNIFGGSRGNQDFAIVLSENIFGLMRLLLESSLF
jgi:hypothetical protein